MVVAHGAIVVPPASRIYRDDLLEDSEVRIWSKSSLGGELIMAVTQCTSEHGWHNHIRRRGLCSGRDQAASGVLRGDGPENLLRWSVDAPRRRGHIQRPARREDLQLPRRETCCARREVCHIREYEVSDFSNMLVLTSGARLRSGPSSGQWTMRNCGRSSMSLWSVTSPSYVPSCGLKRCIADPFPQVLSCVAAFSAKPPAELQERVEQYSHGIMTDWVPQQALLAHPVSTSRMVIVSSS